MAQSSPSGPARVLRAWGNLRSEQRLAGFGAIALFVTMFLPWYSKSAVGVSKGQPIKVDQTLTAWGAFSFVEAAVLLVAVFILILLFQRGEDRPFHLPGGDGTIITGAGVWVALLVFYRQFDKPDAGKVSGIETTVGVEWGIFLTLLVGLFIAYAGQRLRTAHLAEPANPVAAPRPRTVATPEPARRRASAAPEVVGGEQLSFEEEAAQTEATRVATRQDETEATRVADARPRPRRPLPWEEGPPEFDQHPDRD